MQPLASSLYGSFVAISRIEQDQTWICWNLPILARDIRPAIMFLESLMDQQAGYNPFNVVANYIQSNFTNQEDADRVMRLMEKYQSIQNLCSQLYKIQAFIYSAEQSDLMAKLSSILEGGMQTLEALEWFVEQISSIPRADIASLIIPHLISKDISELPVPSLARLSNIIDLLTNVVLSNASVRNGQTPDLVAQLAAISNGFQPALMREAWTKLIAGSTPNAGDKTLIDLCEYVWSHFAVNVPTRSLDPDCIETPIFLAALLWHAHWNENAFLALLQDRDKLRELLPLIQTGSPLMSFGEQFFDCAIALLSAWFLAGLIDYSSYRVKMMDVFACAGYLSDLYYFIEQDDPGSGHFVFARLLEEFQPPGIRDLPVVSCILGLQETGDDAQ